MNILFIIIIGLIIGIVAKLLMPGRDPGGFIFTTLLGIGGALAASYFGRSMGWYPVDHPYGFLAAVLGAMILLAIYRLVFMGRLRS